MRVTGNAISYSVTSQLNLLAARQARLQQQASSGQRITAPEDDPAAMGQSLSVQAEQSRASQFARNISTLDNRTSVTASALQALKTISDRASEIAARANGIQSTASLQTSAAELKQLIQDAVRLANTQDGGKFVFAGTRSDQPPFVLAVDGEGTVSAVTYRGDASVTETEVAEGSSITVDAPGQNNAGTGPRAVLSDDRYGADFFNHLISLQNHLLAGDTAAIETTDRPALVKDEDNLIFHTAQNGINVARLEAAATFTTSQQDSLQQKLSDIAGADLTSTLVQLAQTQNAYQLAVESGAKLLQLQQTLLSALM